MISLSGTTDYLSFASLMKQTCVGYIDTYGGNIMCLCCIEKVVMPINGAEYSRQLVTLVLFAKAALSAWCNPAPPPSVGEGHDEQTDSKAQQSSKTDLRRMWIYSKYHSS